LAKAATTLAVLLVFGTASAVLADANDRTDYHWSFAQRPMSKMSSDRTGYLNNVEREPERSDAVLVSNDPFRPVAASARPGANWLAPNSASPPSTVSISNA
jgi:hypothetical protein